MNDLFAIAIAVESAPPWGVARGGIVDIAPVRDGKPGYDIASLADFMPNDWSSWPTSYQRVSIEKNNPDEAVVKTLRDWGDVDLETTFSVRDGDNRIHVVTRMTNNGKNELEGLLSGYVVWPDGGYLIDEPVVRAGADNTAPGIWTAAYSEDWALGLRAPFSDIVTRNGRDRYRRHDLRPGETRTFEAWLQIEKEGTLAHMVRSEIDFSQLPSGRVSGTVVGDDGKKIPRPAVVVTRDGSLFAWAIGDDGSYTIDLPAGDYDLYATARDYAQGTARPLRIAEDGDLRVDFSDPKPPGRLRIEVADAESGRPLDARISIREGHQPQIRYLGTNTFFTNLEHIGKTSAPIAPGNYVLEVSAGGGFTSTRELVSLTIRSGQTHELKASISVTADPRKHGWYGADLHHHSDVLDGFTEPQYVLRSELAAGVDIAFLSDHDSVVNNREMHRLSGLRGVLFIPAAELSPSWAHFNVYPLHEVETIDIDTGRSSVQEIFAAARDMGADVIEVNHPYSNYGYFESLDTESVPGGYDAGFDLVEIKAEDDETNALTLRRVWQMWNQGNRTYLAAGSDVHDVWLHESGAARTYVHVDGGLSIEKYVEGLKAGRSFASQGPLVYPELLFGSDIRHEANNVLELEYSVQAVSGLKSVRLIERGEEIDAVLFDGTRTLVPANFRVEPDADTWYSLVVEDLRGKFAYTNPVWVSVAE